MEEKLFERMENLRQAVLEKGQRTGDKLKIPLAVVAGAPEGNLKSQMLQDLNRKYKFYDALAMWLGQKQFWSDEENVYLISLAEVYLAKPVIPRELLDDILNTHRSI